MPGQTIGTTVNIFYSINNGVTWYFETQTTVIDINGEPYVQFTTNHFGDFAITELPKDVTAPVIILNGDATVALDQNDTYTDAGATATDNVDGDITANIVMSGSVDTATLVVIYLRIM